MNKAYMLNNIKAKIVYTALEEDLIEFTLDGHLADAHRDEAKLTYWGDHADDILTNRDFKEQYGSRFFY